MHFSLQAHCQKDEKCVEIRNRACGFAGYKCLKSAICTQRYLNILSKLATRPHDKKRRPAMPSKADSETESDRLA